MTATPNATGANKFVKSFSIFSRWYPSDVKIFPELLRAQPCVLPAKI